MKRLVSFNYLAGILCSLILSLGLVTEAFSQPGDPPGDGDVPITGIVWLVIAGGIFGARAVLNRLRNK